MQMLSGSFIDDIYQNVITKTFPLLIESQKKLLLGYLTNVINLISQTFCFDCTNVDVYEYQFKQNNYSDLVGLLLLLLPFINDDSGALKKTIRSLNDIFVSKVENVDINKDSPKYLYSNLQYNRCIRGKDIRERQFSKEYLDHNYYLLLHTIRFVSHKLYVNWVDILPYDTETYRGSKLFIDTSNIFEESRLVDWDPDNITDVKGLPVDDIYDTISNEFFDVIYRIKWVIYDVLPVYPVRDYPLPMIIICNYILDLGPAVENIRWQALNDDQRDKFVNDWKELIRLSYSSGDYVSADLRLNNYSLYRITIGLLFMFDYGYGRKQDAINAKEYVPFNTGEIDPDEVENMPRKGDPEIQRSLETLAPKHMYEYIRQTIQKLKSTWYYRRLFDVNGKIMSIQEYKSLSSSVTSIRIDNMMIELKVHLTLKVVYSYAKALTHYARTPTADYKVPYPAYPKYWRSLSKEQRKIILDRLNDKSGISWFNIRGYIRKTFGRVPGQEVDENDTGDPIMQHWRMINDEFYDLMRRNLMFFIFQSMIYRGVLSKFQPNRIGAISSKTKPAIREQLSKTTLSHTNTYFKAAYYYLTNTTYAEIPKFSFKLERKTVMAPDYFTYNSKSDWYLAYAMNWVAQIGFFHRYLNNRVIFVTGATGVGKSTQIPKLLLYALKAIDYKNDGNVVCTQPRRAPTKRNTETVSAELGVPINDGKFYYLQYKHGKSRYEASVDHLVLKFMVDVSLNMELKPLVKDMIGDAFRTSNQYDVVIIDEAHEHKKSMDLLLTKMKYYAYYNNDVKLVIVSATMDDDEPIYRRYYRDVNDNRMNPLNMRIAENMIDRINVDRRLHISPPGETTREPITEIFEPVDTDPIKLVMSLVDKYPNDFVLYFQPGLQEINAEIVKLNKILPSDAIALPFHSRLSGYQSGIIQELDTELSNIKIDRNIPFTELTEAINKKGNAHYNRAVIVATNIAEASLTIVRLKAVVDTGTQKTPIYDYVKNKSNTVMQPITESSRLQRRGRVGRKFPGEVHYLYPISATKGSKTSYELVIDNIYYSLYSELYNSYLDVPLFDSANDPNTNRLDINALRYSYAGLDKIIQKQYFLDRVFYSYIGNSGHYDYENRERMSPIYISGFSFESLTDSDGKFYIIHPEELYIKRNIVGQITGVQEGHGITYKDHRIVSKKMTAFWNMTTNNMLLSIYGDHAEKTKFGIELVAFKRDLETNIPKNINTKTTIDEFDLRFIYLLLYGISLDRREEVIRLCAIYYATGNNFFSALVGQVVNGKYRKDFKIVDLVGKRESDSEAVLSVLNDFHIMLGRYGINIDQSSRSYMRQLEVLKQKALSGEESSTSELIRRYIYDGMLENTPELTADDYLFMRSENISVRAVNLKRSGEVAKWAEMRGLNVDFFYTYIDIYLSLQNYLSADTYGDLVKILTATLTPFISQKDKLTVCLMHAFKTQIVYNIAHVRTLESEPERVRQVVEDYCLSIYDPSLNNISRLPRINPFIMETFVERRYLQKYILYISESEDDKIYMLHYINPALLKNIGYIYSRDMVYGKYNYYLSQQIQIKPDIENIHHSIVSIYKKALVEIMNELLANHDVEIWTRLNAVFDKRYLETRRYADINYLTAKQFAIQVGGQQRVDLAMVKYILKKFEKQKVYKFR